MKLSDIHAGILIIDDDSDVRSAIRLTLEAEPGVKYIFREADSVSSGLEALQSARADVVILDIHMPGEDGYVFLNKLKKNRTLPLSNVIVLTADNTRKSFMTTVSKGLNPYHFIGKPFASDELRALVLSLAWPRSEQVPVDS